MKKIRAAFIVCVLFLALPLAVHPQSNPPSQGRKVTELYQSQCASCHGADMAGASAPGLRGNQWKFGGDDVSLTHSIRDGDPEAGMPAMRGGLNNAEIRGLIVYIREQSALYERSHTNYNAPQPRVPVKSEAATFQLEPVTDAALREPWGLAFLPDGTLLVTERKGNLRLIKNGQLVPEPVQGMPAVYGGEGGLLDVAVHPDYGDGKHDWIYLSYGDKSVTGLGMTAVIRGRLRGNALVDQQQIFKADQSLYREGGQRFGSRLLFDREKHLFFSIGDRAHPGDEQELSHPNGKIFRVEDDGGIPKDNPFVNRAGAIAAIWTFGHRNAQGLVFSPVTGDLWETEHGPRGGDELNIIHRGDNYGWPVITFGINYDGTPITDHTAQQGMEQPVATWVPSIATSPIAFYTGNQFPQWKNNLFLGSLNAQELRRLVIDKQTVTHQEILFKGIGRVRDLVNGPDGSLYVVLNQPDRIMRIVPAAGNSSASNPTAQ